MCSPEPVLHVEFEQHKSERDFLGHGYVNILEQEGVYKSSLAVNTISK